MLKCCGTWRVVHRLWQSWFISMLISSLIVFINLEPIWAYRHRRGGWRSTEHRDQHREPVSLWNYWSDAQRCLNHQTSDNLTFPAFICSLFSKHTQGTQMHVFIQPYKVFVVWSSHVVHARTAVVWQIQALISSPLFLWCLVLGGETMQFGFSRVY